MHQNVLMKDRFFIRVLLFVLSIVFLAECAKRGRPEGGPKDEDAPIMVTAKPPHFTTNFREKEIKIYFDEYIKLKDLQTQLVVSPPLKYQPIIVPQGTPSKYISIKILDTLKSNTTYTFNFGESVIDNTEGNILHNFKYIFSTGDIIDSLRVNGTVKDAFEREADKNITVMLYEFTKEFTDSIIYKEKPLYVANTLDTTAWEITNIKEGKYLLVGLKDVAKNYLFNPKNDKIGFVKEAISVPRDTSYVLNLFKESLPFKLQRAAEVKKNKMLIGYEGELDSIKIEPLFGPDDLESITLFEKTKDTANVWFKGSVADSLLFRVKTGSVIDTAKVKFRSKEVDSLQISINAKGVLNLRDRIKIAGNIPLQNVDTSKVYLVDKDTLKVPYTYQLKKEKTEVFVEMDFDKKYNDKYNLTLYPDAVTDFLGNINKDTLNFNFTTKKPTDYGNLYLTLQNVKSYPIIVQLITEKGELIEEIYATEQQEYNFTNLLPAKYLVRVIYDENKNRKWDTGSFLQKIQPEKVVYYPTVLEIRTNWDMSETFLLE